MNNNNNQVHICYNITETTISIGSIVIIIEINFCFMVFKCVGLYFAYRCMVSIENGCGVIIILVIHCIKIGKQDSKQLGEWLGATGIIRNCNYFRWFSFKKQLDRNGFSSLIYFFSLMIISSTISASFLKFGFAILLHTYLIAYRLSLTIVHCSAFGKFKFDPVSFSPSPFLSENSQMGRIGRCDAGMTHNIHTI